MRPGKRGNRAKQGILVLLAGGLIVLAMLPAQAQQIHRNGFEGRQTSWLRGEDNVRAEEKAHTLTSDYAHLGSTSEFIQLNCPQGKNDTNFANYYYPTQPAPISDDLVASVHVKANHAGIQLQARLVLPKERNPKQLDEPMTVILNGDVYKLTRRWQKMEIANPVKLVKEAQQLLRTQLRRDIDLTDAYIDRLILNLYTGAGQMDVYIDDLEIGPVKMIQPPQPKVASKGTEGATTAQPKLPLPPIRNERGIKVHMEHDKLFVGGKPFFFRAIRYSDTPLKALRDAGFNTIVFEPDVPGERIEEAIAHGFWIVPTLPLLGDSKPPGKTTTLTSRSANGNLTSANDVEALATAITRFISGDSVLFWSIGGALQGEKAEQLEQTANAVALSDPQRPRGADVWDSFQTLSNYVELIGTHRYPLMTSLELTRYRDWLGQRRRLTRGNFLHWTWIQTHIPDWQTQVIYGRTNVESFNEPIGPQPEQIRLLTYLAMASGCRGLAFSSDRFLADSHQGRDRLLMMAMLNQEIHMLEPLLLSMRETPTWIDTSHPNVKAAVLRSDKGVLVLPIWLGGGAQYVPPQGAINKLSMVVPLIPDGTQPWEITPSRVQSLQFSCERKLAGTRIVIPEFDLTSAIVFTSDLTQAGLVPKWQTHSRLVAEQAAQWACDLAAVQLQKVRKTHAELEGLAPPVLNANDLLRQAEERLSHALQLQEARDFPEACQEATRALRPLRILMRAHWEQAIRTLDAPSSSPFAVSFYTLPRHWELHRELKGTTLGANALRDGDFEAVVKRPEFIPVARGVHAPKDIGAPVTSLAGWTVQQQTLDAVELDSRLVPSSLAKIEKKPTPIKKPKERYAPSNGMSTDPLDAPEPTLGESVLKLEIKPKIVLSGKDNKPLPAPLALERTYLAVISPAVRLQPDTWVRISGWVRVISPIQASADGLLIFDSAGGEGLGLRLMDPQIWKKFHLYRKVPSTGVIWVTAALTGIGTAYIDDLKIEPLVK